MRPLLLFALLNGVGTLVVETVWVKSQIALFGTGPEAFGAVLFAYFTGLTAGSWSFRRRAAAALRPLRFGTFFLAALLFSFAGPALLGRLTGSGPLSGFGTLPHLAASLALLPASWCLGALFALLSSRVTRGAFVLLYGTQAAGAMAGVCLGAFYLPYAVGLALTGAAGVVIHLLSLPLLLGPGRGRGPERADGRREGAGTAPAALAFLSGFLSLTLQSFVIHLTSLSTDNSIYAFGSVSVLFLVVLSLSSLIVARLDDRWVNWGAVGLLSVLSVGGGLLLGRVFMAMTDGLSIRLISQAAGLKVSLALAASLVLCSYLFPSFLFPLALRLGKDGRGGGGAPEPAAVLIAANGLGCGAGAVAATFLLLPVAGLWISLTLILSGYAAISLLAPSRWRFAAAALAAGLIAAGNPLSLPLVTPRGPSGRVEGRVVSVQEGRYGIVSVIDYPGLGRTLWLNNTYLLEAGSGSLWSTRRMGSFPVALHPEAKTALMIGVGTGITARGLLPTKLERIQLVELVPEVVSAARRYFSDFNGHALEDPRVSVVVADGRRYLSSSSRRFDIIASDVVTPWNESAADLYTTEHFRTVKGRLNPGGLFCLWLPMYQLTREEFLVIARSMASVFPHTTLWKLGAVSDHAVTALVGSERLSTEEIRAAMGRFPEDDKPDTILLHESGLFAQYAGPVEPSDPMLRSLPLNTLDRPVVEHMAAGAGRALLKGEGYLEIVKHFVERPGNPGEEYFSEYDETLDSFRRTGWEMNLYVDALAKGDGAAASAHLDRIVELPVFLMDRAAGLER